MASVETSVVDYSVRDVGSTRIRWALGSGVGEVITDPAGVGKIVWVSGASVASQKLRLTKGNNFLLIGASDVRRIVAAKSWCVE